MLGKMKCPKLRFVDYITMDPTEPAYQIIVSELVNPIKPNSKYKFVEIKTNKMELDAAPKKSNFFNTLLKIQYLRERNYRI
mgnify:FL=1